jgi:peptidoglycan/LPS O-acetylase OafA/YrhL
MFGEMPIGRTCVISSDDLKGALIAEDRDRAHRGSVALDQWRGLALALVLISHGFFFTNRVNGIGRVGVNLFFFISGILVFRSLSRPKLATEWQNVRRFWWRRLRRLYPALFAYVFVMVAASWWLQRRPNQPPYSDFSSYVEIVPAALGYFTNYISKGPMAFGHLWSLSCEMQFYLLAPLIFLVGGRQGAKASVFYVALAACLVGTGMIYPLITKNLGIAKYHFEFAVWPMMAGFCCEYLRDRFANLNESTVRAIIGAGGFALIISMGLMLFGMEAKLLVIGVGTFLLLPCFLAYLYGLPCPGSIGRAFAWLGERTYSIYLWQQPLTICDFWPSVWHPVGSVIAVAIGAISFRLFEKPFLSTNRRKQVETMASARSEVVPGNISCQGL